MTQALVLAAGLGSRIRPLAGDLPKPLMPFGGEPILVGNLRWLSGSGVTDVWINLHYGAEAIRQTIGDGAALGLTVRYVFEPTLLGTAARWAISARRSPVRYSWSMATASSVVDWTPWRLDTRRGLQKSPSRFSTATITPIRVSPGGG